MARKSHDEGRCCEGTIAIISSLYGVPNMFDLTAPMKNCRGTTRRAFLRIGGLSLFGLSLPRLLEARANEPGGGRDVNCILLWTDGGMSNLDTLDMKPDAPAE